MHFGKASLWLEPVVAARHSAREASNGWASAVCRQAALAVTSVLIAAVLSAAVVPGRGQQGGGGGGEDEKAFHDDLPCEEALIPPPFGENPLQPCNLGEIAVSFAAALWPYVRVAIIM